MKVSIEKPGTEETRREERTTGEEAEVFEGKRHIEGQVPDGSQGIQRGSWEADVKIGTVRHGEIGTV